MLLRAWHRADVDTIFQAHSYTGRVLFREACAAIPPEALVLEIGPSAPLRTLLRQNRPELP